MDEKIQKDRIRGSLIGGAIGDALGYPVEFIDSYAGIQRKYGNAGITRLDTGQWWKSEDCSTGKAWVSDDTQMTLFTACGILNAKRKRECSHTKYLRSLHRVVLYAIRQEKQAF